MKIYKKTALAVLGLSACLLGGTVAAGSLAGTYVTYNYDDAELGLFGQASLDGEVLVFTPVPGSKFEASAENDSSVLVPWTLHVTVTANTGYQISSFSLAESGSYTLGGVNDFVDVSGEFGVRDNDNPNNNYIPVSFGASSDLNVVGASTDWTAGANVAVPAAGWGGADNLVSNVTLTISNQLIADAVAGSSAVIAKEFVRVSTVTTPVPEAETYGMMLVGLGLVGFMVRRRTRSA